MSSLHVKGSEPGAEYPGERGSINVMFPWLVKVSAMLRPNTAPCRCTVPRLKRPPPAEEATLSAAELLMM